MEFFQSTNKYTKRPPKGADLWIRDSVNSKSGVKVKYLAIAARFVNSEPIEIFGEGKSLEIPIGIDIDSRVVVANVTPKYVGGEDRMLIFKGKSKTAFYHTNAGLVDALINALMLDTTLTNHYFKLTRDGMFHDCPRYLITQIK